MNLPKTSLNVIYVEPEISQSQDEDKKRLTKFISLFAQIGYKELDLNKDFQNELNFAIE